MKNNQTATMTKIPTKIKQQIKVYVLLQIDIPDSKPIDELLALQKCLNDFGIPNEIKAAVHYGPCTRLQCNGYLTLEEAEYVEEHYCHLGLGLHYTCAHTFALLN